MRSFTHLLSIALIFSSVYAFGGDNPILTTNAKTGEGIARDYSVREDMGTPAGRSSYPDFDPLGKVGPRRGPAPLYSTKSTFLGEDFEVSVPPPGWGIISTHTDTMTWYQDDNVPYSGSYHANCKYDESLVPQDEWLYTPAMDFGYVTSDIKVTFHLMMSYYWGVDPYDNYNIELWISTDSGVSFPTKLWDDDSYGVFESWTWYEVSISLAAYVGEDNVVLAWRYAGVDGAQASIDLVAVLDDPPYPGRCCFGDPEAPDCSDLFQSECEALGDYISWAEDLSCTNNPCPAAGTGDDCADPLAADLSTLPWTDYNHTCGRGNDYAAADMCFTYGYGGGEDIVYEFTLTEEKDLIFTMDPYGTAGTYVEVRTDCVPPNGDCVFRFASTVGDPFSSGLQTLPAGTYYMIIDNWPTPACIPEFAITVEEFFGGAEGDGCTNPIVIKLPDDLPYLGTDSTRGRVNDYDATCLGSYDGGQDIVYLLDVSDSISIDILLDPKGTTYSGIAIGTNCPLGNPCMTASTSSGSDPHGMDAVQLEPGSYYIMIDTWPSPDYISEFDLSIAESAEEPCDCAPGEANGDAAYNIGDAVYLINYIFKGGPPPIPYLICSGDANCDCADNIGDAVHLINYIFKGGPPPCDCPTWLSICGAPLRK